MSQLGLLTSPEAADDTLVLLPLGATEQHGPHLPLDTDTRIATALAQSAADVVGGVWVAPTIPFGASGEHQGFSGTMSIGTNALRLVLVEIVRSIDGARPVMFVNGHGGNHAALTGAVVQLQAEGHRVQSWSPRIPGADSHAGHTETSLMLALAPEAVRMDRAETGRTEPLAELLHDLIDHGMIGVTPNGVLGNPMTATAEDGHQILHQLVSDLADAIRAMMGVETP